MLWVCECIVHMCTCVLLCVREGRRVLCISFCTTVVVEKLKQTMESIETSIMAFKERQRES